MPEDPGANWGKFATIGLEVAVGVGVGFLIGNWIDHRYGSGPWGAFAGSMLGCAGGLYLLIKEAIRVNKD